MRIDLPVKPALLPCCRQLIADGVNPGIIIHVYRGATLCFVPAPLSVFAALATEERADRSIRFIRHGKTVPQGDEYAPCSAVTMEAGHE